MTANNLYQLAKTDTSLTESKLLAGLILLVATGFIIWLWHPQLEHWISQNEQAFAQWLKPESLHGLGWLLLPVAFAGGHPCDYYQQHLCL